MFLLFSCVLNVLTLLRSPVNNTKRDAKRARGRAALPGDADFKEAVRAGKVIILSSPLLASPLLSSPHHYYAYQIRRKNDASYTHVRSAALHWSGSSDDDEVFAGMRAKEQARGQAAVAR